MIKEKLAPKNKALTEHATVLLQHIQKFSQRQ